MSYESLIMFFSVYEGQFSNSKEIIILNNGQCYAGLTFCFFNLRVMRPLRKVLKRHQGQHMVKNTITLIEICWHQDKTSKGHGHGRGGLRELWDLLSWNWVQGMFLCEVCSTAASEDSMTNDVWTIFWRQHNDVCCQCYLLKIAQWPYLLKIALWPLLPMLSSEDSIVTISSEDSIMTNVDNAIFWR